MADLSNIDELNNFLADKSYIEGYTPSQADITLYKKIGTSPDKATHPHAARWFKHIASFSYEEYNEWPGEKTYTEEEAAAEEEEEEVAAVEEESSSATAGEEETKPKEKKPAADDDDIDLFGDDDDEEAAAQEADRERRAQEALAKKAATGKVLIAKSMVTLDVKPLDDETNMEEVERLVRTIVIDGLEWKSSKFVPLCYGIKKLQIQCVVIDDKVSVDDITEQIEAFDEVVQSVDVAAFNKL